MYVYIIIYPPYEAHRFSRITAKSDCKNNA